MGNDHRTFPQTAVHTSLHCHSKISHIDMDNGSFPHKNIKSLLAAYVVWWDVVWQMIPQAKRNFFKVKYFSGAFSHGAKIHSDAYTKKLYRSLYDTIFLRLFLGLRSLFLFCHRICRFYLKKIFPACYTLPTFPPYNRWTRIEIEGAKLVLKAI